MAVAMGHNLPPLRGEDKGDQGGSRTAPRSCAEWMRSFGVRKLAAAFLSAGLLAGSFNSSTIPSQQTGWYHKSQPACWLVSKRQQAAALQSGLRPHKHWVRGTGLLQRLNRYPAAFAAELKSRMNPQPYVVFY
jgi:hypothetical protein